MTSRMSPSHAAKAMTSTADTRPPHPIEKILEDRIAIIDGAMGTTIRTYGMTEADIRGERFKDSKKDLLNNGDLFSLTQPTMICDIHRRFLEAGADIIETNTFGATSITQSEFFVDDPREHGGRKDPAFYQKIIEDPFLNDLAWEINEQSARQCREWADRVANADGAAALRGRRDRAADGLALELARCRRRGLPRRHVRSGQGGLRPAGARADRRRLRPAARRDHLRLAQRQGGAGRHPGGVRRGRQRAAGHDLGRGRARRRDDDLGADGRGVLERGRAREAALGRAQLLARPGPDVSVPRGARREVDAPRSPAIRTPACRIRCRRPASISSRRTWPATSASSPRRA